MDTWNPEGLRNALPACPALLARKAKAKRASSCPAPPGHRHILDEDPVAKPAQLSEEFKQELADQEMFDFSRIVEQDASSDYSMGQELLHNFERCWSSNPAALHVL